MIFDVINKLMPDEMKNIWYFNRMGGISKLSCLLWIAIQVNICYTLRQLENPIKTNGADGETMALETKIQV